jgi:dynein heavy chain 1
MEVSASASAPAGPEGAGSPAFPAAEAERLLAHLSAVAQVALGATADELEAPGSLLHDAQRADTIERCLRFANDSQNVLYVQKDIVPKGEDDEGGLEGESAAAGANG